MLTTSRGLLLFILLSIVTLGIYPLYLIHAFAKETNLACRSDGKHTRGLLAVILFSLITFGIYAIVWEAMIIDRRGTYLESQGEHNNLSVLFFILALILTPFTLGILALILRAKQLYQQNNVNGLYNKRMTS